MSVVAPERLSDLRAGDRPHGVTSVCSAHPLVLRAALRHGQAAHATVLIEATCNQVNHLGGYSGMTPKDFSALVHKIADEEGCNRSQIVLGGDHLGPNPWRDSTADAALDEASKMVEAYILAGFRKIHLDASMGCKGEPAAVGDEITAERAARLAAVAETAAVSANTQPPLYIIGTEVPAPGGADHELDIITPTSAEAALKTVEIHRRVFQQSGLAEAFERVIALVVQPGVEFGNSNVVNYDRKAARSLSSILDTVPNLVFEAHSTDFQDRSALANLVEDGFAILKVGPELTFTLREALYALDAVASDMILDYGQRPLQKTMEALMLRAPAGWDKHYSGSPEKLRILRHYSLSDRIRYYWTEPEAQEAVERLLSALTGVCVPRPVFWQYLPAAARFSEQPLDPVDLIVWRITERLAAYHAACDPKQTDDQKNGAFGERAAS